MNIVAYSFEEEKYGYTLAVPWLQNKHLKVGRWGQCGSHLVFYQHSRIKGLDYRCLPSKITGIYNHVEIPTIKKVILIGQLPILRDIRGLISAQFIKLFGF